MVPKGEDILDSLGIQGESLPCTGDSGTAQKAFILAAFRGDTDLFSRPDRQELADADIDDEVCDEADLRILSATAAANCGISSNHCYRSYRIGVPPNIYDLIQEMGRVDRDRTKAAGENRCKVHVSWPTFVTLFIRVMRGSDSNERKQQMLSLIHI